MEAELNSYLMTPAIDGEQDPLAWWKVHMVNFPSLSKLVRKYLCIPATSSPSLFCNATYWQRLLHKENVNSICT